MRNLLRATIRHSQRKENYLMERRIHAQEEVSEASDDDQEGQDQEDKAEKAKDKED